jgi:muramoyltetrapeptide carboxypeptidase
MPIKPPRLVRGATVGIVAPASAPLDPKDVRRSAELIEHLGFQPRLATGAAHRHGFLAGSDRQRATDLMRMFTDRRVQAIFCLRGGYGTGRLLSRLDYSLIRAHPKILLGYSDITALSCALLARAELVSFHGPMLATDLARTDRPSLTVASLERTLMESVPAGNICAGYHAGTVATLRRGVVSGPLLGGNLSVLCTTLGTPYQPVFKGAILFFEEVDEAPYRIDRLLTHLLNAGVLQQVAGIAVGLNRGCVDPKAKSAREYRQTVEDVLKERLLPLKVPLLTGLPFGHSPFNVTLPLGIRATLNATHGDLAITEPAVV